MSYLSAYRGLGLDSPNDVAPEDVGLVEWIKSSADNAVAYLREQWDRFVNLYPSILNMQHRAATIAYDAKQRGDTNTYNTAQAVIRTLGSLAQKHDEAVRTMQSVAQFVGLGGYNVGLGAIPVAYVAILTALALVVVWFFRVYDLEEHKLELLENGTLTPEQMHLLDPGPAPALVLGQAAGLVKWVLVGLGLWIGWQVLEESGILTRGKRRAPRARRNPPLLTFDSNPPGRVIGEQVYAVWYRHAEDGEPYVHEFGPGVELVADDDGGVHFESSRGRRLWDDFDVDED